MTIMLNAQFDNVERSESSIYTDSRTNIYVMPEDFQEEFKVTGEELLKTVKELIAAGNARRIIIRNEKEETLIEIPLTIGAIGAILLPVLAAIGAIAALVAKCSIVVIRNKP